MLSNTPNSSGRNISHVDFHCPPRSVSSFKVPGSWPLKQAQQTTVRCDNNLKHVGSFGVRSQVGSSSTELFSLARLKHALVSGCCGFSTHSSDSVGPRIRREVFWGRGL